jgi:hypothetical protein
VGECRRIRWMMNRMQYASSKLEEMTRWCWRQCAGIFLSFWRYALWTLQLRFWSRISCHQLEDN